MQLSNLKFIDEHIFVGENLSNSYILIKTIYSTNCYKIIDYKINNLILNMYLDSNIEIEFYKGYFGIRYKVLLSDKTLYIGMVNEKKFLDNYSFRDSHIIKVLRNFCHY
jgi:hypothetical protein